jgi:hypothetical protein
MQIVQNVEAMLAMSQAHTTQRQMVEKGKLACRQLVHQSLKAL